MGGVKGPRNIAFIIGKGLFYILVSRHNLILRATTTKDATNLAALAIQVWLHTYARDGIRSAISEYVLAEFNPENFTRLIESNSHTVLVAEINEHLVGYASLKYGSSCRNVSGLETELVTLYVQEHFSRRGMGSALLAACAAAARDRSGYSALWLKVNCRNSNAIAFYLKHGFAQAGSTYFELGAERHENHVLVRRDV